MYGLVEVEVYACLTEFLCEQSSIYPSWDVMSRVDVSTFRSDPGRSTWDRVLHPKRLIDEIV
jgi:hypothetical protein